MREKRSSTPGETTRLSMLKPRRANTSATRTSTPGLLLTNTEIACVPIGSAVGAGRTAALISRTPRRLGGLGLGRPGDHVAHGGAVRGPPEHIVLLAQLS